ncbi:hypothetical protein WDU94_003107 [Cyamophila willieti]
MVFENRLSESEDEDSSGEDSERLKVIGKVTGEDTDENIPRKTTKEQLSDDDSETDESVNESKVKNHSMDNKKSKEMKSEDEVDDDNSNSDDVKEDAKASENGAIHDDSVSSETEDNGECDVDTESISQTGDDIDEKEDEDERAADSQSENTEHSNDENGNKLKDKGDSNEKAEMAEENNEAMEVKRDIIENEESKKGKIDMKTDVAKSLMKEIRTRSAGGRMEDRIQRLMDKSNKEFGKKSEKKITGSKTTGDLKAKLEETFKKNDATKKALNDRSKPLSKTTGDLKAKLEETFKKNDATKKDFRSKTFEEKSKVMGLLCKDIIAAKKDQIDRRMERSKEKIGEKLATTEKKINKINLDLKSKLEQGLDFNKTKSKQRTRVEETRETTEIATPNMSGGRKNILGKKLRPKSVGLDHSKGGSADDFPDLLGPSLPPSADESLDSVTELPGASASSQLQHLVKSRPKRAKTRAPTRAAVPAGLGASTGLEDDGLDGFFSVSTASSVTLVSGGNGTSVTNTPILSPLSDDSSLSSLVTDTPTDTHNNLPPAALTSSSSTPLQAPPTSMTLTSSLCFNTTSSTTTQGKTTTLPHLKSAKAISGSEDVPRSRSSDNVGATGTTAPFGKLRGNTVDLGGEPDHPSSKIDGTAHLKRNTKLTGTAVDLIRAKKSSAVTDNNDGKDALSSTTTETASSSAFSTSNNNI